MNKFKRVFAVVLSCLIAACSGIGIMTVRADDGDATSEFDDWEYFYDMNKSILQHHTHPKKLLRLPLFRQAESYACGVACVLSLLRYVKYDFDIREDELATALHSNEDEGTRKENVVGYLNAVRYGNDENPWFNAEFRQGMTIDDIKQSIDNGNPVICAIQAWKWDDDAENYRIDLDYTNEWESGHWAIAIGYNRDNIFFMDPSTAANYTYISNESLMERWHDYEGAVRTPDTEVSNAGIVVELCGNEQPDCERYKDVFYKLPS